MQLGAEEQGVIRRGFLWQARFSAVGHGVVGFLRRVGRDKVRCGTARLGLARRGLAGWARFGQAGCGVAG